MELTIQEKVQVDADIYTYRLNNSLMFIFASFVMC